MKKDEKIIIFCYVLTVLMLLISSIYTFYKIKPNNMVFNIEKVFKTSANIFVK